MKFHSFVFDYFCCASDRRDAPKVDKDITFRYCDPSSIDSIPRVSLPLEPHRRKARSNSQEKRFFPDWCQLTSQRHLPKTFLPKWRQQLSSRKKKSTRDYITFHLIWDVLNWQQARVLVSLHSGGMSDETSKKISKFQNFFIFFLRA